MNLADGFNASVKIALHYPPLGDTPDERDGIAVTLFNLVHGAWQPTDAGTNYAAGTLAIKDGTLPFIGVYRDGEKIIEFQRKDIAELHNLIQLITKDAPKEEQTDDNEG